MIFSVFINQTTVLHIRAVEIVVEEVSFMTNRHEGHCEHHCNHYEHGGLHTRACITLVPIFNHLDDEKLNEIMCTIKTAHFEKGNYLSAWAAI